MDLLLVNLMELRVGFETILLVTSFLLYLKYRSAITETIYLGRACRSFLRGEPIQGERNIVNSEARSLLSLLQISQANARRREFYEKPVLELEVDNTSNIQKIALSLLTSAKSYLVSSPTAARIYLYKQEKLTLLSETGPSAKRFERLVDDNVECFICSKKLYEIQIQDQSLLSYNIESQLFLKFFLSESEPDLELVIWFGFKDILESNYRLEREVLEGLVSKARLLILQFEKIAKLENKLEEERDGFVGLSHDLKAPGITALYLVRELLSKKSVDLTDAKRYLDIELLILEQLSLIQDFLDIEQSKTAAISVKSETIDLSEFISSFTESPIIRNRNCNIKFNTELDVTLLIQFDRNHLKRILTNLLSNAFKYAESGEVVLGLRAYGDSYELFVSDTGRGVSLDLQSRLFSKFSRLDAPNEILGTGIGLSAAKLLAEKNVAELKYSPKEGGGSVFSLTISPELVVKGSVLSPGMKQQTAGKLILVLEDDEATCRMYSRVLSANGLDAEFETTVAGARSKLLSERRFDGVICDIRLSDGESSGLLSELIGSGQIVPTIVISGAAEFIMRDDEAIENSSYIRYLTKPVDRIELELMLDEVWG